MPFKTEFKIKVENSLANRDGGWMRKVGILGGTFDPVHWGHLLIAETALSQVELDQVIWIPTECPSHKQAAIFEHRLEMVQKAIADHPAFTISLAVGNRSQPSYAIDTLINLQAIYPDTDWYWIVGLDTFQTLPRWYRHEEIATRCNWLIAPRLRSDASTEISDQIQLCEQVTQQLVADNIYIQWQILQMPLVGLSSSLVRQYCGDRRSLRYLVPEVVRIYIATHNLYSQQSLSRKQTQSGKVS